MRLKILTTALLLFGLGMALLWPHLIGPAPKQQTAGPNASAAQRKQMERENVRAKRQYLAKSGIYLIVLLVDFSATAVLALLVARQAREEYRAQAMANMKSLLEDTLQDHRRKHEDQNG